MNFFEQDGVFSFSVFDNAIDLPIKIFSKLPRRNNEFVEIAEYLYESKASIVVDEASYSKYVRIVFDGKGRIEGKSKFKNSKVMKKLAEAKAIMNSKIAKSA